MERKNIVIGVVLLVVIIAAAGITMKRSSDSKHAPVAVTERPVTKIDTKTYEVITLPFSEWMFKYAADPATGYSKNPKTGECTMADVLTCEWCGKQIPAPPGVNEEAVENAELKYVCPLCGKLYLKRLVK